MKQKISAKQVKKIISSSGEFCFIDIRELGQHAEGHPFFSISIPFSIFENKIEELIPNKNVLIIIFDGNDGLSEIFYEEVKILGYKNLSILADGIDGWRNEGYELYDGINVPSKAFGEWIEKKCKTPHIKAQDVAKKIKKKSDIIILDGRTKEEFKKMNIPSAINCPNMEIPVRIKNYINKTTEVIISCAGRTRSIIGTQNLINFGIKNSVKALENGTQGWQLANFQLENNQTRRVNLEKLIPQKSFLKKANLIIKKYKLRKVNFDQAKKLYENNAITTYIFDITETSSSKTISPNKIIKVPGGQLIQATDNYIGVWNAKIILLDDGELVRASMTATWLKQMGHEAYVYIEKPEKLYKFMKNYTVKYLTENEKKITFSKLKTFMNSYLLDVRNSHDYRKLHLIKSRWTTRANMRFLKFKSQKDVVLIYDEPIKAQLAAKTIKKKYNINVYFYPFDKNKVLKYPELFKKSPYYPKTKDCIDFVYHTHKRHQGNKSHARAYLNWEKKLLERMDNQELKRFTKL